MDQQKDIQQIPETEETYQTGAAQPTKSHGGIIALLLGLVILLCGITSALSLMNIRMFWQLNAPEHKEYTLSFTRDTQPAAAAKAPPTPTAPAVTQPPLQLVLDTVPQQSVPEPEEPLSVEDSVPQDGLVLEAQPPEFPLEAVTQTLEPSLARVTWTFPDKKLHTTGLVLSADGYLLTGTADTQTADSLQVQLWDARILDAILVGQDDQLGLSVLQVQAEDLHPASFCDTACLTEGQQIVSLPSGNVTEVVHLLPGLLQTNISSAAGEPFVNQFGQVVGISAGNSGMTQELSQVLGFAVPSSAVKESAERLIREYVPEEDASLGLIGEAIPLFHQLYYELPEGFYITAVDDASDAFLKGISIGDILISVNGQSLDSITNLSEIVQDFKPGDTVSVVVYRSGQHYELIITLGEE